MRRSVPSLTANQILLGRSLVGRRRFDGLAVAVVVGRRRRLRWQRGRGGLLRICFSGDAVLAQFRGILGGGNGRPFLDLKQMTGDHRQDFFLKLLSRHRIIKFRLTEQNYAVTLKGIQSTLAE